MAVALSTLQHYQADACAESMTRDRSVERAALASFARSRLSRRRYRVIASARRLTALFETSADGGGRVQAAMS